MRSCVPFGCTNVGKLRASVSKESITDHVCKTVSKVNEGGHIAMLVLSGHLDGKRGPKAACENLEFANRLYRETVESLPVSTKVVDTSFLTRLNSHKLQRQLAVDEAPEKIQTIFEQFFNLPMSQAA